MSGHPQQPPPSGVYGGNARDYSPPRVPPTTKKLQQTQAEVDEVVNIMRVNVDKVLERDQKLSELDDRAAALTEGASQFEASATRLKRKMWWQNTKMIIIMVAVAIVLLIIIIVWATAS